MSIYLDNAATTPLDPAVFAAITPYLLQHFGNPSSAHQSGREAKTALDNARATIAKYLNAAPEEIIFTSGGTEADNLAIVSAITCGKIDHVITTRFEHPAVLQTLKSLSKQHDTRISFIEHDGQGNLDLKHLEYLLRNNTKNLVSVMHANNEVGNINDIEQIGLLCKKYSALFHTDAVQTAGHYQLDVKQLNVDFLAASAHKFHGPKGVGFLYCRQGVQLSRLIHGGGQERQLRSGTENIAGIVGAAEAFKLANRHLQAHSPYVAELKNYLISRLTDILPDIQFNGNSADVRKSSYTILSASLPYTSTNVLSYLDAEGIAVSGGSACCTGTTSAVLQALGTDESRTAIRFSFSKFNTKDELNTVVEKLVSVYQLVAA